MSSLLIGIGKQFECLTSGVGLSHTKPGATGEAVIPGWAKKTGLSGPSRTHRVETNRQVLDWLKAFIGRSRTGNVSLGASQVTLTTGSPAWAASATWIFGFGANTMLLDVEFQEGQRVSSSDGRWDGRGPSRAGNFSHWSIQARGRPRNRLQWPPHSHLHTRRTNEYAGFCDTEHCAVCDSRGVC